MFHLQLKCTSRKSTDSKILSLSSFPSSILELKQAIESRFSIPVCVQSVSYQLAPLSDSDSLLERRIRSGDTLSVSYLCEADCKLIREVIEWLKNVTATIQIEHLTEEGGTNTDDIIKIGFFESEYPILFHKSFRWLDPKCYANKLYFKAMGGLQAVIELYRYEEWYTMPCIQSRVVTHNDYCIWAEFISGGAFASPSSSSVLALDFLPHPSLRVKSKLNLQGGVITRMECAYATDFQANRVLCH